MNEALKALKKQKYEDIEKTEKSKGSLLLKELSSIEKRSNAVRKAKAETGSRSTQNN
jgi:predicted ribosome quality control (RQC) complex YloA/Tae2 family protein